MFLSALLRIRICIQKSCNLLTEEKNSKKKQNKLFLSRQDESKNYAATI